MTHCKECGVRRDTWVPPYRAFCRAGPACPAGSAVRCRRADRDVRPYGCVTRGAMGGRPQGSPLRSVTRSAMGGPMWASAPTERLQEVRGKNPPVTALPCQSPLGKGAWGRGTRIATASVRTGFAMTHCMNAVRVRAGDRKGRPYGCIIGGA